MRYKRNVNSTHAIKPQWPTLYNAKRYRYRGNQYRRISCVLSYCYLHLSRGEQCLTTPGRRQDVVIMSIRGKQVTKDDLICLYRCLLTVCVCFFAMFILLL